MRIQVKAGDIESESAALASGQSLMVGREPSHVPALAVASPSVSGHHALVTYRDGQAEVTDLGSRNGSWLELPSGVPVRCAAPTVLRLHLGPPWNARISDEGPADSSWTDVSSFASAVARAVEEWLDRRAAGARVEVVPALQRPRSDDVPGRMPLTRESDLLVNANHTMDPSWVSLLWRVDRYVQRQVALFAAEEDLRDNGLVVASPAMKRAVREVVEAAQSGARNVLLIGPSGAGKEGLAACFHRHLERPGPFISRNCATFQFGKDLVLSELFGAEKGSFTGATRALTGAVEAADGGTLLLDEIGDLPLDVQSALLRFLDRGEYTRLGATKPLSSDVRIVGATNKDLRAACLSGQFRRDLWFRLSMRVIEVPPLSQRFEDVAAYLRSRPWPDAASLYDAFTDDARALLAAHPWEGNFRELINFTHRLPKTESTVGQHTCHAALAAGALSPVSLAPSPPQAAPEWTQIWEKASQSFRDDHLSALPRSWDDVKDFVEGYLKPLVFASLSGSDGHLTLEQMDLRAAAERLHADRGTALKQLERYVARFGH